MSVAKLCCTPQNLQIYLFFHRIQNFAETFFKKCPGSGPHVKITKKKKDLTINASLQAVPVYRKHLGRARAWNIFYGTTLRSMDYITNEPWAASLVPTSGDNDIIKKKNKSMGILSQLSRLLVHKNCAYLNTEYNWLIVVKTQQAMLV